MGQKLICFSEWTCLLTLGMVCVLLGCETTQNQDLSAGKLKVDYLENPVGLENTTPEFSWLVQSENRNTLQTGYQIQVATEEEFSEESLVWNSGHQQSDQSINIPYSGEDMESAESYYWQVRVWDNHGNRSEWSDMAFWEIGQLSPTDWLADWITTPDTTVSSPLFRSQFNLEKEVASARLYVAGVGYYEAYLNGQKVGDHVLDPAITNYEKKVLYEIYDVSDQISQGVNALGLWLGKGAYRINRSEERWTWYGTNNNFGTPAGIVQLHVQFNGGTEATITSDSTWKTDASPITYNNVYGGEDYDARLEQPGWAAPGFDDAGWQTVEVVQKKGVQLESQLMEPIRVTETIDPVRHTKPGDGPWLYDLDQNIPGWWQIKVQGEAGTQVKIRAAETLNDSLFPTPLKPGDRLSTRQPFHDKAWTTYTLNGRGTEVWEPRFFYTGFRYLEVQVSDPQQIEKFEITGRVVHSDLPRNGQFHSSDSLLNDIYEAAIWSQHGNWHGYPTDCPHREKGGYNGDGQVVAEVSMHDFHMQPFFRKWIGDMRDAQQPNGRIPNTSPTLLGGTGGGIAWGSAYILIPWWMHQYAGGTRILEEHYPSMQHYMEYLGNLASRDDENPTERFIINEFGGHWDSIGEWEAPVRERNGPVNPLTHTYYWYLDAQTMAKIAGALGNREDQSGYLALADSIKQAFNEKFFNPQTNLYGTEEPYQTYLLFALHGELVPEGHRQAVLHNLINDIVETHDGHLATGILGTKHLFSLLAREGREDVIHRIVTQTTFPSWGYWLQNGATTLWENWRGEGSHNHQMFGSVNEYFYKYLAGICAPTDPGTTKGYRQIHISPYIPADLQYAEASIETVSGSVSTRWEKKGQGLILEATIPANATAKITIPDRGVENFSITESGTLVWDSSREVENGSSISIGTRQPDGVTFEVGSGEFSFRLAPAN